MTWLLLKHFRYASLMSENIDTVCEYTHKSKQISGPGHFCMPLNHLQIDTEIIRF